MSKKLLSVLSAILLILNTAFLLPVSSAAAEKDIAETGVTAKNITLTATDGTKVSAVPKSPSKITVLVFGYPGCRYTRHFLIDLSASDLVNHPNYHFIYADIAGNTQSAVSSFQTRFSDQITFCCGDNSPILDKLFEDCTGVPAFVYIDTDGAVRLTEEGYGSLSSIEYRLHSIEGDDTPSGDEDHISWTLNGTELTLSGTGDMRGYDSSGSNAAPWGKDITKVIISDGITSIGEYAFYGCENLKKITIPNSVTEIGDYAFYGCESLKSITVPESVSHIGEYALGFTYGDVPLDNFVIYGYQRSKAERYTAEQNLTFIALDAEREVLLGDADQDGKVSVMDATAIQKRLASIPVKSCHEKAADADEDDSITILDATSIQKHLAKLPSNSHIGNPIGK